MLFKVRHEIQSLLIGVEKGEFYVRSTMSELWLWMLLKLIYRRPKKSMLIKTSRSALRDW